MKRGGPPSGLGVHSTLTISRPCTGNQTANQLGASKQSKRDKQNNSIRFTQSCPIYPSNQSVNQSISHSIHSTTLITWQAHLEVALAVVQEALGEHLVHAGVLAVRVRRLRVAVVHLEHAAGRQGGRTHIQASIDWFNQSYTNHVHVGGFCQPGQPSLPPAPPPQRALLPAAAAVPPPPQRHVDLLPSAPLHRSPPPPAAPPARPPTEGSMARGCWGRGCQAGGSTAQG